MKSGIKLTAKFTVVLMTVLFGIAEVGTPILISNADAINSMLNINTQVVEEGEAVDDFYFKSAFTTVAGVRANGKAYNEAIMAEGITLVKNETAGGKPSLPLGENAKVSFFSTSSVSMISSGLGSSYNETASGDSKNDEGIVDLKTGAEAAGLTVNETLWNWYYANFTTYGRKNPGGSSVGAYNSISDATWDQIDTPAKTEQADAAIFVISRSGGEGRDLAQWQGNELSASVGAGNNDMTGGNYLALSPNEADVLKNLKLQKDAGVFRTIVVLMNSANEVQCDFLDKEEYGVDSMLWIGTTGSAGAYAVGGILSGKVNPSGKLSDTFWKSHALNPANANFAANNYSSGSLADSGMSKGDPRSTSARHIVYAEGIYVGYRYTETRYEDAVLGQGNAGDFRYQDVVSYPFGFGLSYTTFRYSDFSVTPPSGGNDVYTLSVTVKNTGSVAGKEAVQFYLQKPYTAYDKENKIEKASVELVGFAKTKLLGADEQQTLTAEIPGSALASYDAHGAKTYVVDEGTYYFTAAADAHSAVNNILAAKGKTTEDGMTAEGDESLVHSFRKSFDKITYSTSKEAMNKHIKPDATVITNQFDSVDILTYGGAASYGSNAFSYLSRSNWTEHLGGGLFGADSEGNRTTDFRVTVTATDKMYEERQKSLTEPQPSGTEYPTYGKNNDPSAEGHLNLIDLRAYADDDSDPLNDEPIPYDAPLWDQLLDQLTWKEQVDLVSSGGRMTGAIPSIAKPATIDHNGSTGPVVAYGGGSNNRGFARRYGDVDAFLTPCTYPCNGIAASTFNIDLLEWYGKQWGEDCAWAGYSGLYGMGVNTHRSPYGGRNFEYYSEDPYLSGISAACVTRGMATRGAYVYLKHCALNEQETYRNGGYVWANEQSIREVYLKCFEIAIEEGDAQCVMTSMTCMGLDWSGQQGFLNTVLRDEFGMTGHAVSDMWNCIEGNFMQGIFYGNDLIDGSYSAVDTTPSVLDCVTEGFTISKFFAEAAPVSAGGTGQYGDFAWQMRECVHRMLYTVVHSNAMNGISSSTRILHITPVWMAAVNAAKIAVEAVFAASVVFLAVTIAWDPVANCINKKKEKKS